MRITRRFALTRPVVSLRAQVERLALGISPDVGNRKAILLVQVGRFVEVPVSGWRLGLRQRKVGRRRTAGAPWRMAARLIERGLAQGYRVAGADERASLAQCLLEGCDLLAALVQSALAGQVDAKLAEAFVLRAGQANEEARSPREMLASAAIPVRGEAAGFTPAVDAAMGVAARASRIATWMSCWS